MRIEELTMTDFKGVDSTTRLGRLTLLVGPNGTGKTARLDALRFAVQGDCRFGAQPQAVAKLGSHKGCGVRVKLDDGFAWTRKIERNGKTKAYATTLHVAGHDGLNLRDAEPILAGKVGRFAPTFDLGAFLGLSDDKRRDYVLELCGSAEGEADIADLLARANLAYLADELGAGTVAVYCVEADGIRTKRDDLTPAQRGKVARALNTKLSAADREALAVALARVGEQMHGMPTPAAVAAALEHAKTLANESRRERDRAQQAVARFTAQRDALQLASDTVEQLKTRRAELVEQRTQAREQIANQEGRSSGIADYERKLSKLAGDLAAAEASLATLTAATGPTQADADAARAQAKQMIDDNPEPMADFSEAQDAADAARRELNTAAGIDGNLATTIRGLNQQIDAAQARLRDLEQRAADDPWMRAHELYRHVQQQARDDHPMTEIDAWVELGDLIAINIGNYPTDEVAAHVEGLRAKLGEATGAKATAAVRHESAIKAMADAEEIVRLATEQHAASHRAWAKTITDSQVIDDKANEITRQIDRRQIDIEATTDRIESIKSEQVDAQRALQDLQSAGGSVPVEQLQAQVKSLGDEIEQVDRQITAKERHQALESELTRAIAAAEHESVMHEVCKQLADAVRTIREELMHDLVRPLVERINRFLDAASATGRAYCDLEDARGKPVLELGWLTHDGTRKVPLPAMSGGETVLYGVGLAYALVTLAAPPLKLLMIEAAEVDDETGASMLGGLVNVADDIDNVVIATCHLPIDVDAIDHAWNVVELGDDEARSAAGEAVDRIVAAGV